MIYFCQKGKEKKNIGVTDFVLETSFWRVLVTKNTLHLKNRASLAYKATMFVIPKVLQLDLSIELFSAKYCLSGSIK